MKLGNTQTEITDAKKFKEEYESLNNLKDENGANKYLNLTIPENNPIKYATISDIENLFDNKTAIVYFGFNTCPWCRNLVPVLIDTAINNGIDNIYYMSIKDIRDTKELDENGNIKTTKEGSSEYQKLLELFDESLDVYDGLNDNNVKRIYAPTVFFIKDGKVASKHVGTVSSQDDPKIELTSSQKQELSNILLEYINDIGLNSVCNEENKNC